MKNPHISLSSEPEPIPYPEDWRERLGGMNLKQQKAWSDGFNACRKARQLMPEGSLTYNTEDIHGVVAEYSEPIGTKLLHLRRMSVYQITGFCWLGATDEWGFLHHEVRGDGLNGPTIARPLSHIHGTRSNGEPRYEIKE